MGYKCNYQEQDGFAHYCGSVLILPVLYGKGVSACHKHTLGKYTKHACVPITILISTVVVTIQEPHSFPQNASFSTFLSQFCCFSSVQRNKILPSNCLNSNENASCSLFLPFSLSFSRAFLSWILIKIGSLFLYDYTPNYLEQKPVFPFLYVMSCSLCGPI